MAFSIFLLLASVYIRAALGGALKVIDYDRQCVIWSDDNPGCCMGLSASFGLLDGDSCSDISQFTNGTRQHYSRLNVDACGTENDQPAAWIEINDNGVVKIFHQNGDETGCTLENGLKVGSSCIASKLPSATSSSSTSSPSEPSSSVSSSSATSSSTSSSSTSSPSSASASSGSISSCTGSE